jgi:hypothetical protein
MLAATVIGCARPPFYSIRTRTFEAVEQRPSRAQLVGRWRSPRETLVLLPNGKFTGRHRSGCWDVMYDSWGRRDDRILLVFGCVHYGHEDSWIPELSAECAFTLGEHLALRDCEFAGEYRRA